jgi:hypothetical protein
MLSDGESQFSWEEDKKSGVVSLIHLSCLPAEDPFDFYSTVQFDRETSVLSIAPQ